MTSSAQDRSADAPPGPGPQLGSPAVEAVRLFEALQRAAAGWSSAPQDIDGGPRCEHQLPQTCRICPLCQVAHRLQQVRPEVVQHLADATASLAAALGELAGNRPPASRPEPRDQAERIDITD